MPLTTFIPAFITRRPFPAILALGLLLRLGYAWIMREHLLLGDGGFYHGTAERILMGEPFSPFWPPGLPYLLALFMYVGGQHLVSVVAGMMLVYVAFASLLHHVVRKWVTERAANLVSLVFAVSPAFIHHSVTPLTHLPVALCLLTIACIAWNAREKYRLWEAVWAGLALGAAILIRPGSLILAPVLFFLLIRYLPAAGWKRVLHVALPFVLAGCMVLAWELQTFHRHQRIVWVNDGNSSNFYLGNNPWTPLYKTWWLGSHNESENPHFADFYAQGREIMALPQAEQGPAFTRIAWHHISESPGLFLVRSFSRIRCFFAFDTFTAGVIHHRVPGAMPFTLLVLAVDGLIYVLIGSFALLGFARGLNAGGPGGMLLLLVLAYAFPYFIAFSHPTYHLPVVPLLAIVAASEWEKRATSLFFLRKNPLTALLLLIFWGLQVEWVWHMKSSLGF